MKRFTIATALSSTALTLQGCGASGDSSDSTPTTTTMSPQHNVTACAGLYLGSPPENKAAIPTAAEHDAALKALDLDAVKADVVVLMKESQACWPADYGSYGPFFIRLAWHCSGTYRKSDGKGGCAGGRQRFEPERSWADNTNLDKARALLAPIKEKYGAGLSWGDLYTLAGTTALRSMGTPIKQFCVGRIDSADGTDSVALGPSAEQAKTAPCTINGLCKSPLGSTTVGLIYLNPEGRVKQNATTGAWEPNPDPTTSVDDIRDSFNRMDHDDRDTVALIGGGHAFGKAHGACPNGAGQPPNIAYGSMMPGQIPWPGLCGTGVGSDAFTSGMEGPWTTDPLKWDNQYFQDLLPPSKWEVHKGPGNHWQWRLANASSERAGLMRMTSDMALLNDDKYLEIVKEFAGNMSAFEDAFDTAWTKLMMKGGSWSSEKKCDSGTFPEHVLAVNGMLPHDVIV
jgi:catalase (peroxidase I)